MPTFSYECRCGKSFERFLPIPEYAQPQVCECGSIAQKVFLTFPFATVDADIRYDSPIDGKVILSKQQRIEDLARSGCSPYDPGSKQDYQRRIDRENVALEKAVDETVDRKIATMPVRKRDKLAAEMEGGLSVEPIRVTPSAKPIKTELNHG